MKKIFRPMDALVAVTGLLAMHGVALAQAGGSADATANASKSPKEVCNTLVDAAKKDDFNTVKQWTLWGGHGMRHDKQQAGTSDAASAKTPAKGGKMEAEFHKMHDQDMAALKDMSCGSETLAGDHAMVQAESKGQKRLIPFAQRDGRWMFDARTYMSFYREDMKNMRKSS
jgi:hypothetical protein